MAKKTVEKRVVGVVSKVFGIKEEDVDIQVSYENLGKGDPKIEELLFAIEQHQKTLLYLK